MNIVDQLCEAARELPGTNDMDDREVLKYVADHYDGGFTAFVAWALDEPNWEEVRGALANRYGHGFAAALLKE